MSKEIMMVDDMFVRGVDDQEVMEKVVLTESFPEFYKWVNEVTGKRPKEDREDTEDTLINIYLHFWTRKINGQYDA